MSYIKLSKEQDMREKHCNMINENCITLGCVAWETIDDEYGYCIDIELKKKRIGYKPE